MESNYWSRILRGRVSRRRALASTGAAGFAAAFLAACGDDDDGSTGISGSTGGAGLQQAPGCTGSTGATGAAGSPGSTVPSTGSTSLVFQPTDETSKGQSGGIYPHNHGDLEFNIDPVRLIAPTSFALAMPVTARGSSSVRLCRLTGPRRQ